MPAATAVTRVAAERIRLQTLSLDGLNSYSYIVLISEL